MGTPPVEKAGAPEPPRGWRMLFALGPGLVWSLGAVGVSQLIFATRAGALYGHALLWVPFIAIFLKFFITELMGRYTIATGKNVISAFGRVELRLPFFRVPRGWTIWIFWSSFLVMVAGLGGIALAVGSALYGIIPALPAVAWSGLALLSVGAALVAGGYRVSEWIARVLLVGIVFFIAFAVFKSAPSPGEVLPGLVPRVPSGSLRELVPFLGWVGSGAIGTMWFSLWTKGSGRGAAGATAPGSPRDGAKVKEWLRVNRTDLGINAALTAFLTAGFIVAGAVILRPLNLVPDGEEMGSIVARIAGTFFGRAGEVVFLLCMAGILYSIMAAHIDGLCRLATTTIGYRVADEEVKRDTYRFFLVIYIVLSGLIALLLPYPVVLLQIAAIVDTLLLPVVAYLGLSICTRFLEKEFQPGPFQRAMVWAGAAFFLVFTCAFVLVFFSWLFVDFF